MTLSEGLQLMWYIKNGAKLLTQGFHKERLLEFLKVSMVMKAVVPDDLSSVQVAKIEEVVRMVRILSNQAQQLLINVPSTCYVDFYGKAAVDERRFYNIGAGSHWAHPQWTPVDMFPADLPHAIKVDLWDHGPWPIESGKAKLIFTSHCIEHLDDDAIAQMFSEAMRIAEPGAVFRVTAPDVDLFYREYRRNNRYFYDNISAWGMSRPEIDLGQIFLSTFAFPASCLSTDTPHWHISSDELTELFARLPYEVALDDITGRYAAARGKIHDHINWINRPKLVRMLKRAGFVNIECSGYGLSRSPVMQDTNFFDCTSPEQSLYVEAEKPR